MSAVFSSRHGGSCSRRSSLGPWLALKFATKPYRRSAMTTAVDKWPACAKLLAVAPAGHLPTAPTPLRQRGTGAFSVTNPSARTRTSFGRSISMQPARSANRSFVADRPLRLCDQPPRSAQTAPAPVHLLTRSPSRLCASCRGSPIDHGAAPPLRHDRLRPPLPPAAQNLHLGRSASFWNPPEGGFLTRGSEGRRGRPDAYVELGADLADLRAMKANPRVFAVMLGGVRTPEQTGAESAEDLIA